MSKLCFLPEGTYILIEEATAHSFNKWKIHYVKSLHRGIYGTEENCIAQQGFQGRLP